MPNENSALPAEVMQMINSYSYAYTNLIKEGAQLYHDWLQSQKQAAPEDLVNTVRKELLRRTREKYPDLQIVSEEIDEEGVQVVADIVFQIAERYAAGRVEKAIKELSGVDLKNKGE